MQSQAGHLRPLPTPIPSKCTILPGASSLPNNFGYLLPGKPGIATSNDAQLAVRFTLPLFFFFGLEYRWRSSDVLSLYVDLLPLLVSMSLSRAETKGTSTGTKGVLFFTTHGPIHAPSLLLL